MPYFYSASLSLIILSLFEDRPVAPTHRVDSIT